MTQFITPAEAARLVGDGGEVFVLLILGAVMPASVRLMVYSRLSTTAMPTKGIPAT